MSIASDPVELTPGMTIRQGPGHRISNIQMRCCTGQVVVVNITDLPVETIEQHAEDCRTRLSKCCSVIDGQRHRWFCSSTGWRGMGRPASQRP